MDMMMMMMMMDEDMKKSNISFMDERDLIKDECRNHNSSLVTIETRAENYWLKKNQFVQDNPFIGAYTDDTRTVWRWVSDDSIVRYSDWEPGEPNDFRGREDCVQFKNNEWNDIHCTDMSEFICEQKDFQLGHRTDWINHHFDYHFSSWKETSQDRWRTIKLGYFNIVTRYYLTWQEIENTKTMACKSVHRKDCQIKSCSDNM
ncbi:collectin-12-like [Pecten maximus]|uniref:collectin-12-like n=1 Tax=Pecten maximus TaxID=6579 RepID=UPI001458E017|nr:collectin-12-like [Pecten maximus]